MTEGRFIDPLSFFFKSETTLVVGDKPRSGVVSLL